MGRLSGCGREACEGQIGRSPRLFGRFWGLIGAIAGVVWATLGVAGVIADDIEAAWGLPG